MLFMRTFTFWFILALSSFVFILFVYYKNSQRTNKPLNFIFLAILFIAIFASSIGTWWYSFGRKPKLADQAKTVATQAKNVAQTGATQVKNAAAKPVNLVKDKLEKHKQEKEVKKDDDDNNKTKDGEDNNKGPTVGEKAKAAGQSIKDKLKRKPKTDEPAPTPEKSTDDPATDTPKTDDPATDESKPGEPTTNPEKSTDKPAPTPEKPTDKSVEKPTNNTNKSKITQIIENAKQKIKQICETKKGQHEELETELEEIKDEIEDQTNDLVKTTHEIKKLDLLTKNIDDLIKKAKEDLEKEERSKLSTELQLQVINKQITLETAKSLQLQAERNAAANDLIKLQNKQQKDNDKEQMKDIVDQIESKKTTIATLDKEIGEIEQKIIILKKARDTQIRELELRELNINRLTTYIKRLEKIEEDFWNTMDTYFNSTERKDAIDKHLKHQRNWLNKQMDDNINKHAELEAKRNFYEWLKTKAIEANIIANSKSQNNNVNLGKITDNVAEGTSAFIKGASGIFSPLKNALDSIFQTGLRYKRERIAVEEAEIRSLANRNAIENEVKQREERLKTMQDDVAGLEKKYRGFIKQLFDDNGYLKPINDTQFKQIIRTLEIELEKETKELEKLDNLILEKEPEARIGELILTSNISNQELRTKAVDKSNALQETVNTIKANLKELKKKDISQTDVDITSKELLKLQIQDRQLITQRDTVNGLDQSIINDDKNQTQKLQTEFNTLNQNRELKLINNNINNNN